MTNHVATRSSRQLSVGAALLALLLSVLAVLVAATPADAAPPDDDRLNFVDHSVSGPTQQVKGVLTPFIDESLPDEVQYSIVRPDNTTEVVDFGRRKLPDSATEATITAEVTSAGLVRSATIDPAAGAAAVRTAHTAYVAVVRNHQDPEEGEVSDEYIQAYVDASLARLASEGTRMISSFTRVAYKEYETTTDCKSGSAMWNEAASTLYPDVDFSNGVHLINVAPAGCAGGVGTVGGDVNSGGRLNVNSVTKKGTQSLLHEMGHNLSLSHAHSCIPAASPNCSVFNDYGNSYEIMGTTWLPGRNNPPLIPAVYGTFERERLGFAAPGAESIQLSLPAGQSSATTTHDLTARSSTAGLRGLRITDPVTAIEYIVSWRSAGGADDHSYYHNFGHQTGFHPGIVIQQVNAGGTSASVLGYAKPTPDKPDFKQFGRFAGDTYTAGGVSINVVSLGDPATPASTSRVSVTLKSQAEFTRTPKPILKGTARVGITLGVTPGTWQPTPTSWGYQWLANGARIAGATRSTFRPTPVLAGRRISVQLTGKRAGYRPVTQTSASALVARGVFTAAAPKIIGTATVGRTLKLSRGTWRPAPSRWAYQWLANGRNITGVTGHRTYLKLTRTLKGKRISVKVTGSRPGYVTKSRTSARTRAVR